MRILLTFLIFITAGPIWADAAETAAPGRIVVTGQAMVSQPPDMAVITLGVSQTAETAADALAATNTAMVQVLARLGDLGIAERDIQTSGLGLTPRWSQPRSNNDAPSHVVGFEAANMVTVRLRDMDGVGGVLDAVVRDGANEFRGLHFDLQAPGPVRDQARKAAVADAMARAALYAAAAGVTLGPVIELREGGAEPMPMMRAEMSMAMAVPVAGGEVDVRAEVTMVFAIAD